ncbi:MAG: potassium-transporting ATPase subunit KdpA [bacterium]|nr:potassium-transporting ATPase subunit KdpA [bacterium]
MPPLEYLQIGIFLVSLLLLAKPLGIYIARVYSSEYTSLNRVLQPIERLIYRITQVDQSQEMSWKSYTIVLLLFNLFGFIALFAMLLLQGMLPLNPQQFGMVQIALAFNTAVSFVTNTNWQAYGGETTMSYFSQMVGLGVQNFVSAATGMAAMAALIRGLARKTATTLGNFWVDLVRSTLYVLLPLSFVLAVALIWQGVPQTFQSYQSVQLVEAIPDTSGSATTHQTLPLGPAASQIAIKQLGTNGGGFFNVNSAHPFENPTPLSNLLEMLVILLIPAALCFTFGKMVGDKRQGNALLIVMFVLLLGFLAVAVEQEVTGNPRLTTLGVDQSSTDQQPGGNMEGKEVRFGVVNSAIWATATTAVSNGSVNAMHDSFTPLGGLAPMLLMQLGEIVFGGVGSGLYGMLIFVIVAVFIAGLMVGRTPEYLGKKIEAFEMKMASIVLLVPIALVLIGTAIAVLLPAAKASVYNPGAHGFSEILYAFSSAANNNGSAFGGLSANTNFYNVALGIAMMLGRFMVIIPVLAIAGSMVQKRSVPAGPGTFPTHGWLFVVVLSAVILVVGALSFFPALALGPIVEHLQLWQ